MSDYCKSKWVGLAFYAWSSFSLAGPVHERAIKSWHGAPPALEFSGACDAGGKATYLTHFGASVRTLIGVCVWSKTLISSSSPGSSDGVQFSQRMDYYAGALSGSPLRQYLGCSAPNAQEFHLMFYDIDDGFSPGQAIFTDPNASLVLEKTSTGRFVLQNKNMVKDIWVSYRLGTKTYAGSVNAQDAIVVGELKTSQYIKPYRDPDKGVPCN